MVPYYLMLSFMYSIEDFNQNFAIKYDNWRISDDLGMSEVLYICTLLFL